eukprot:SAG25_NODE_782_length_5356_cov_9.982880_2_plen_48_part_00
MIPTFQSCWPLRQIDQSTGSLSWDGHSIDPGAVRVYLLLMIDPETIL